MVKHKVFVYGTLKEGQPNHTFLLDKRSGDVTFVCSGKTKETYPLVIGIYNLPCLLYNPGIGKSIIGEVYEVDDKKFQFLDQFEDHPVMYTRKQIDIMTSEPEGDHCECWCYFYNDTTGNMKDMPMLDNFDSKDDHGLPYDESELEGFGEEECQS